jgi:hypothetical protein
MGSIMDRPADQPAEMEPPSGPSYGHGNVSAHGEASGAPTAHEKRKPRLGEAGLSFGKRGIGDRTLHK